MKIFQNYLQTNAKVVIYLHKQRKNECKNVKMEGGYGRFEKKTVLSFR